MEIDQLELDLSWMDTGDSLLSPLGCDGNSFGDAATRPEFFDESVASVKFSPEKQHTFAKTKLGGRDVLIWKPDGIVDDSTLMTLDVEQGFAGAKEEIANLEACQTGHVIDCSELARLKADNPHIRIIPSRWVSAFKSATRVRTRIIAKDINRGVSARKLGISSPTLSVEGLHLVLGLAAKRSFKIKSMDVAHAFMHSPIPDTDLIVLQLPQSVSLKDGSLAFLVLAKALNGLRDASLAWITLLSKTIQSVNLTSDEMEPCIYQGVIAQTGRRVGAALLVAYVDDLLLCSENDATERLIEKTIGEIVPLKVTGEIKQARHGGGSLIFIGRHIFRNEHSDDLTLGVDAKFLDSVFREYGISKASTAVPDVASHIENRENIDRSSCQTGVIC